VTLDALRAATEPVKVEAMQAIVTVGGSKEGVCVCGNGDRWPSNARLVPSSSARENKIRIPNAEISLAELDSSVREWRDEREGKKTRFWQSPGKTRDKKKVSVSYGQSVGGMW
jgi:hypothetical protein